MRMLPFVLLSLLSQAPQGKATFSSRADLVVVHVCVVDKHAGFVAGLPREAFTVREDGRPREIAFFANEDTPVTVGLVIDSSGSMASRRDAVIAAGLAFAASSHPADEMFTVNFNEHVWSGLADGHPFTSDHNELREALSRSGARGKTALFDAIDAALHHLDDGQQPRKVLLVISDGGDNASHATSDSVLDAALRRDVVIYTIGLIDPDDGDANPGLLRKLSEVTGGESFFPKTNDKIGPTLERIARDIRSSYTLGYVPPAASAGTRRQIRVDVQSADRRKLAVRARSLYIGSGSAGAK